MSNPVNQTKKHSRLSNKYNFVSTENILSYMRQHGWSVRSETAARCRNADNVGFQKHIVRLEHRDFKYSDYSIEILITNSHMGNSSLKINIGIYRFVCANGLVVGTSFSEHRIKHIGFTYDKLGTALSGLIARMTSIREIISGMSSKQLTRRQQEDMARRFANKRLEGVASHITDINIKEMLLSVREEDRPADVFTVYNKLQERVIRGGIEYSAERSIYAADNPRELIEVKKISNTTRGVKSINKEIELNKYMFDTAVEFLRAA